MQFRSPAAHNDVANWVSPDGSVASFHEYQERKWEKEQERAEAEAEEAEENLQTLQELVAKKLHVSDLGADRLGNKLGSVDIRDTGGDVSNDGGGEGMMGQDRRAHDFEAGGEMPVCGSQGADAGSTSSSAVRGKAAADDREGRAWLRIVHRRLGPSLISLRQAKLKVGMGDLSSWQVTAEVGQMLADVESNLLAVAEVLEERIALAGAQQQQDQDHGAETKTEEEAGGALDAKAKQADALRSKVSLLEGRVLLLSQAKSALELKLDDLESQGGGGGGVGFMETKKMSKFQLEMSAAKDAVRCVVV